MRFIVQIKCAWELDGQKEPIPHLCSLVWMGRGVCGRTLTIYLTIKFLRIFIIFNGNKEILVLCNYDHNLIDKQKKSISCFEGWNLGFFAKKTIISIY